MATTTTTTDCRLTSIEKNSILEALQDQPAFSKFFMDHLLSRNSRIKGDVIDQLFNSSEKRLACLLLLLANYGREGSLTETGIFCVRATCASASPAVVDLRSR
jgi:CRP/FNR family transcriptional regulator, cyclic AMP receptor protein